MKLGKRGYQVFKKTYRWVALGGEVVEGSSYFIREWTGWRWIPYEVNGHTRYFPDYDIARDTAECLVATARAERENRRSLGIFQEPVEEIIWV